MLIPFVVGLLAVFLTYLTRNRQNGAGLKMAFMVIFVYLALRYDYGNDYMAYLDGFNEITSNVQIFLTGMRFEPGWNLLHLLFKPFGFFAMVAFTSLLTCVVFYRFIRDYVPAQYQWLAVLLYTFDPYLLLVPASAMRQNMGIILFLVAIEFLYKKRIFIYLLFAVAAATFHKSGVVLLPLIVLPFISIKINKLVAAVVALGYAVFFWLGGTIFNYISGFIYARLEKYAETYTEGASFYSGIGFIYSLFQLGAILYFAGIELNRDTESDPLQEMEEEMEIATEQSSQTPVPDKYTKFLDVRARRLLFILAIITFLFVPLGLQLAMIGRINMYFTPVLIVVYPIILFTSRDKFFRVIFLGSLIPFTLFKFWAFFLSPVWQVKFGTYQTIFSAPQWY
jgi:transmembrane protein EpsG